MILRYFPLAFTSDKTPQQLGYNGRNWPGVVRMSAKAPMFTAVYAQEICESCWKAKHPFAGRSPKTLRELEFLGHAVETVVAVWLYEQNEEHYIDSEARGMMAHYSQFIGWTERDIQDGIRSKMPEARAWVSKRMKHLLDVKKRVC